MYEGSPKSFVSFQQTNWCAVLSGVRALISRHSVNSVLGRKKSQVVVCSLHSRRRCAAGFIHKTADLPDDDIGSSSRQRHKKPRRKVFCWMHNKFLCEEHVHKYDSALPCKDSGHCKNFEHNVWCAERLRMRYS